MKMVEIKNFEMPASCSSCSMMLNGKDMDCVFVQDDWEFDLVKGKYRDCPLVEIKESEDGKID